MITAKPGAASLPAGRHGLVVEPPRGQQVLLDGDRLGLVTASAASAAIERLLTRLRRGQLVEPLDLPETVWLVLAIIVLEQPITRAEITARRLADSDRQVQSLEELAASLRDVGFLQPLIVRPIHASQGDPARYIAAALGLGYLPPMELSPTTRLANVLLGDIDVRGLRGRQGINLLLASALTDWRIRLREIGRSPAWRALELDRRQEKRSVPGTVQAMVPKGLAAGRCHRAVSSRSRSRPARVHVATQEPRHTPSAT